MVSSPMQTRHSGLTSDMGWRCISGAIYTNQSGSEKQGSARTFLQTRPTQHVRFMGRSSCSQESKEYSVSPNTAPKHSVDSPQVQSWSGRSQYRRNSAGRPSGLRWLSCTLQSDSARNKSAMRQWRGGPWDSFSPSTWLQTGKHLSIPGC